MGDAGGLPDYVLDHNAVIKDEAAWRYGQAPDYTKTRAIWEQERKIQHEARSLPDLVEKLVKNWEIEASHKMELKDWRTVDVDKYRFSVNGGPPQTGDYMLKVGTYNAILSSSQYYCPMHSTFDSSHKTFKRTMPTFAWEVLEVYSPPPVVTFRWRHWGTMKEDYTGFNSRGEKVTLKAHGGPIDIQGVAVAKVNDALQLEDVSVWFDPEAIFRQMTEEGRLANAPEKLDAYEGAMELEYARMVTEPTSSPQHHSM